MKTKYINKFVNEYGQVNNYSLLEHIRDLCKHRLYTLAQHLINELYEIYIGTEFENVNNSLFIMTFDEECEMFLLIDKIADKVVKGV